MDFLAVCFYNYGRIINKNQLPERIIKAEGISNPYASRKGSAMNFSKKEYEQIFHFLNEIRVPPSLFRKKVQTSLADLFGYSRSIFWLADHHGNLYSPEIWNISDQVLYDYMECFFQYDILHPKKQLATFPTYPALRIDDVMSLPEYEKTNYYSMFMRKYNYYHEMVVYFMDEGKLCGVIGMARLQEEKPYTEKDCKRLTFLSNHISHVLGNYMRLEDISYQKRLLEARTNVSTTGFVLVDYTHNIHFVNEAAQHICQTFKRGASSIEEFLHYYVYSHPNWKAGINIKISFPGSEHWTLQVVPEIKGILTDHPNRYGIYLFSEEEMEQKTVEQRLSRRELEICELVIKGRTNEQIANELWISINTVKKHLRNIYEKLNVANRTSLAYKLTAIFN